MEYKIIYLPRNTTTLLAGIDLPTWQRDPLKGTGLNDSHNLKEKPALLKINAYLAAHMNKRGTNVVFVLRVSHDL